LSDKDKGGSSSSAEQKRKAAVPDEKKARKHRAGDIGRALRTIYDDTLREPVPDDFSSLLGKLT
jgi:Anti-sigma factor NepR